MLLCMYIKQIVDRINLQTHLKGHQNAFTSSRVILLGSSVFYFKHSNIH